MSVIKPVFVMFQPGVDLFARRAVLTALHLLLKIAVIEDKIKIFDFGYFQKDNKMEKGILRPYCSIDWYIEHAKQSSIDKNQLDAAVILTDCMDEPGQKTTGHYDLVVVCDDLTENQSLEKFTAGLAKLGFGAVFSIFRFLRLNKDLMIDCIITGVLHEMGHVFGLPNENRKVKIEERFGKHCTNICVMRHVLNVPKDYICFSRDRLCHGPFCKLCMSNLRQYFSLK